MRYLRERDNTQRVGAIEDGRMTSRALQTEITMSDTLSLELLQKMDAYWRAANYLTVGQIYLKDNPLLEFRFGWNTSKRACLAIGARRRG